MFSTLRLVNKFKPIKFKPINKGFPFYHNKKQLYMPRPMLKEKKRKYHTITKNTYSLLPSIPLSIKSTIYTHKFHISNIRFKVDSYEIEELRTEINNLNKEFKEYKENNDNKHKSINNDLLFMYIMIFITNLIIYGICN